MNKKIIAAALAAVMCISACGCSGGGKNAEPTPAPVVEVIPSTLLTINDAISKTGTQLVQDGEIEVKDGTKSVLYRSEPWGVADTVKVSVEQYTSEVSKESIKQKFDNDRSMRADAVDVDGMENCFTAFPSAYYYNDGYYIKITAGSGSTDEQRALLVSLIQTAASNLNGFIAK